MGAVERARTVRGIAFGDVGPDIYEGVDGEEPTGSATMSLVVVAYVHKVTDATERPLSRDTTSSRGFFFRWAGSFWGLEVADGSGTTIRANVAGDADVKTGLVVAVCSFDGVTAVMRVNGIVDSDGSGAGGYTEPDAARSLTVGALDSAGRAPANSIALSAFLIDQQNALSAAQLDTLEDEVRDHLRHGRDLATAAYSAFVPEHGYDARDAGSTWADRIGAGTTLTRNGNPERMNFRGAA